ncbi:hypothetical protein Pmani_022880 [Petrolisthes manimaculis]|uniref:Uncharacterized protein n=1 Tax=Petrolisthes manimaculis TaxID=1843537 RepID=A0AAE1PD60_9EUCA|nr:hypothetical protein Pmani_022880 [Petrolisthes manimaculis]
MEMRKDFEESANALRDQVEQLVNVSVKGKLDTCDQGKWKTEVKDKIYQEVKEKIQNEVREDLRKSTYSKVLGVVGAGGNTDKVGAGGGSTYPEFSVQIQNEDVLQKTTMEVQGRMDRENNIVLYGIPEQVFDGMDLSIREEKVRHDKLIFVDLCAELGMTCYKSDIEEIRRIGKNMGVSQVQ